jgi:hypothetical protein
MPRRAKIASISGTILVLGAATAVALPTTLDLDPGRARRQAAPSKPTSRAGPS